MSKEDEFKRQYPLVVKPVPIMAQKSHVTDEPKGSLGLRLTEQLPPVPTCFTAAVQETEELEPLLAIDTKKVQLTPITNCPHPHLKHFAKGMCNHCYHRFGRSALSDKCPHTDRKCYAKGKCQNCYINEYNRAKRQRQKSDRPKGRPRKHPLPLPLPSTS